MASLVERAVSAVRDGRVVSGLKSRAIVGSKLAFVGSKLAFDFVRPSDVPAFSFERLSDSRFYAYLLTALTHAGTVECPVRDLVRACTWLRSARFRFQNTPNVGWPDQRHHRAERVPNGTWHSAYKQTILFDPSR